MERPDRLTDGLLLAMGLAACMAGAMMALGPMGEGEWQLCGIFLLLLAGLGAALTWRLFQNPRHRVCAAAAVFLAMCLRMCLFDYATADYNSFLTLWVGTMRRMSVREALITPIGDYNMPYLYLLLLLSRLPVYDLYGIKLISLLADVFLAAAASSIARLTAKREGAALGVLLGVLLAPTAILNSGLWAQCDAVYSAFALWGLYFGLKEKPVKSVGMFAFAFAFKLQAIFILPILLFLLGKRKLRLRHLIAFPAAFLAVMLPALLAGRSFSDTFGIYLSQTGQYPYLSLNAPSVWALIPNDYFSSLSSAAVLLAGICTLLLIYLFLPRHRALEDGDLVTLSLIFCLAIPWLLPRMHERYFYLAEMLSVIYAAERLRNLPVAAMLLGGGFLIYSPYLFYQMPVLSNGLVAVLYGLLLVYLTADLARRVLARETDIRKQGGDTP